MNPPRTNRSNDGRDFQAAILKEAALYESQGILTLRKCDAPVRMIGSGPMRKIIPMRNPFLDFVGVWTERGGRALFIEAKSTATHRLPINRDAGLTENQCNAMSQWSEAGAAVALIWRCQYGIRVLSWSVIQNEIAIGMKSLCAEDFAQVENGWLAALRDAFPSVGSTEQHQEKLGRL